MALHMGYSTTSGFRMKHFVSDPALEPDSVGVKYADSLRNLLSFVSTDPLALNSEGAKLYASHTSFPGLGKAKEFGIMHHMELRSI